MMRIRLPFLILAAMCLVTSCTAMDRWAALSMIESGDDDSAIGPGGEISRYQIRPELWPGGDPQNTQIALAAAQKIMLPRIEQFKRSHQRMPTDFEFYVLWNAPWQADHPSAAVTERARRFSNLIQR